MQNLKVLFSQTFRTKMNPYYVPKGTGRAQHTATHLLYECAIQKCSHVILAEIQNLKLALFVSNGYGQNTEL